ncbi:MAG: DUF5009 domain-containing protein [Candidatus Neomarinimicrobiota bacterium]
MKRLASLDAFRGLTIAGMILVNNPGDWSNVYWPLLHAKWHGWTPTDWIFPFFLFIIGVAMALSFRRREEGGADKAAFWKKVLIRTAILFGLGLVLAGYPRFDFPNMRILSVLQRLALCYLVVSAVLLTLPRPRHQWLVMGGIIALYLGIMYGIDVPGHGRGVLTPEGHASGYIDRLILGESHLWRGTKVYDPEGLVSTLPAIFTAFLGLQFGRVLLTTESHRERLRQWLIYGVVLVVLGQLAHFLMPINKQIWSPSYALFMSGLGGLFLAACYWLIDVRGLKKWATPFIMLGLNPLFIFWMSGFLVRNLTLVKLTTEDGPRSLWSLLYRTGFLPFLSDINASLAFALANVAFWLLVAWFMYRRKWFIKI